MHRICAKQLVRNVSTGVRIMTLPSFSKVSQSGYDVSLLVETLVDPSGDLRASSGTPDGNMKSRHGSPRAAEGILCRRL